MALLVAILTFLIATAVFLALWFLLAGDSKQQRFRRRMEAVRKAEEPSGAGKDLALVRDETYSSVPLLNRALMRVHWTVRLQTFIAQSGMTTRPAKILLWSGVLGFGAYLAVIEILNAPFAGAIAGCCAACIPLGAVAFKRRKRLREFEKMFPEALDLLSRAVRAGHAFTTGLEMIASESPELLAGEFRKTFEERNFGLPMRDALVHLAERVPLVDVRFFVTALLVQKETGGNLAEILDELARLIRDRFRIQREVRVKTAQGRLTAMILIGMPVAMLIILEIVNPRYVNLLFVDRWGTVAVSVALTLQIFGSVLLWKIVHIEV